MEDTEVVRRAQAGDREAFQHLYETYLPKIYDFVLGMLRNKADAEDATSETFLKCVERLGDLREPAAFKGWLYTIARNAALRIVDGRGRATPVAEHLEAATTIDAPVIPQPEARAEQTELRDLFDDAASTLSERERTVYDLTVRHGLGSAEIARVMGVRPAYAYILVNRLKGSVSEALEAVLLAKVGRGDCADLSTLLDVYAGEVSPRMRKAVSRHAKTCAACAGTRSRKASVPALLEGMAFAQPGTAFASELGAKLDAHWAQFGPGSGAGGAVAGGVAAGIAGAVLTVVFLTGAAMGFGAQRTIIRHEPHPDSITPVTEVQPAVVQNAPASNPSPSKSRSRTPSVAPQAPSGPSVVYDNGNTTTYTGDGTSTTSNDTNTSSDNTGMWDNNSDSSGDEPMPPPPPNSCSSCSKPG